MFNINNNHNHRKNRIHMYVYWMPFALSCTPSASSHILRIGSWMKRKETARIEESLEFWCIINTNWWHFCSSCCFVCFYRYFWRRNSSHEIKSKQNSCYWWCPSMVMLVMLLFFIISLLWFRAHECFVFLKVLLEGLWKYSIRAISPSAEGALAIATMKWMRPCSIY